MATKILKTKANPSGLARNKAVQTLPKRVEFKYKFADDFNPVYANGAHGGISTQGEIVLNFYLERQPVPFEEIHSIDAQGKLGPIIERTPVIDGESIQAIRFVASGVVLSHETAKRIRDFLDRQIQELERREGPNSKRS